MLPDKTCDLEYMLMCKTLHENISHHRRLKGEVGVGQLCLDLSESITGLD